MILVDKSPLVAFIDAGQGESHRRSLELFRTIREPLLTTWCCFTEAMYFLQQRRGWLGQKKLWIFIEREVLFLHVGSVAEQFYSKRFIPQMPPNTEMTPISRTIGTDQLVDEMVFKFTHTIRMDWMLPGIAPTGKRVEVPLVAIILSLQ